MDLVTHVSQAFTVDRARAEKAVGAILSALRVSIDKAGFEKVKAAVPGAEGLIGKAMQPGGRTAEMAALVAPSTLLAALASQGWNKEEIPNLLRAVLDLLRPVVGDAAADRVFQG
jgi:hypothetical protein